MLRKEKCTGDPVRRLGNDLLFQQLAEANLEALRAVQDEKDHLHLPALRAHHPGGLEGVRHAACRWSTTASFWRGYADQVAQAIQLAKKLCFTIPVIWGAIAASTTSRAGGGAGRQGGEARAVARTQLLLRSRRRAGVSGRGNRRAREPRPRRGAGRHRSAGRGRGLPLLQYHVSGCSCRRKGAKAHRSFWILRSLAARGLPSDSLRYRAEKQKA